MVTLTNESGSLVQENVQYPVLRWFQQRTPVFDFVFITYGFFFQSVPQVTKCLLVLRVSRKSQNTH